MFNKIKQENKTSEIVRACKTEFCHRIIDIENDGGHTVAGLQLKMIDIMQAATGYENMWFVVLNSSSAGLSQCV